MKIEFKTSFNRDLKKIANVKIIELIEKTIENVESADNVLQIDEFKKLKGSKKEYFARIKTDTYRIGIKVIDNVVYFVRCLPRKDIYKYFPN